MAFNIVEFAAEPYECAFDQPCKFGHRVEGHAVYCQNDAWVNGPRKCRRTWYTGGETKDEDCPGFQPNPEFSGSLSPSPLIGQLCTKCGGARWTAGDRETIETCDHCVGDGTEPSAMSLSQFEQDTLEMGLGHSYRAGDHPPYVQMTGSKAERESMSKLCDLNLVQVRSVSYHSVYLGTVSAYLLFLTGKGEAVMRANWAKAKS